MDDTQPQLLLSYRDVTRVTSLSLTEIKRRVRAQEGFPQPRVLGPRCVRFLASEVRAWAEELPTASKTPRAAS